MPPSTIDMEQAEKLFAIAEFDQAYQAFLRVVEKDGSQTGEGKAAFRLGMLDLMSNRLEQAEPWLEQARVGGGPLGQAAVRFLATLHSRRGDFAKAAPFIRELGDAGRADMALSLSTSPAYQLEGSNETEIPFEMVDPLPVVEVDVNGRRVPMFIDTGGAHVMVDFDFAKEAGVKEFGQQQRASFGQDKIGTVQPARVEELGLGEFRLRGIPATLHAIRRFPYFGRPMEGVIGTLVLYQFLATLDYPNQKLILRKKTPENLAQLEKEAAEADDKVIPFWIGSDHLILAHGAVNRKPMLLFADTGMANNGFTCPESTIKECGIEVDESITTEGLGGGDELMVSHPFVADEISLGDAREKNVSGGFGPFPPSLEHSFGFRIGGIVSHTFFKPYAVTFDFTGMRMFLRRG